MSGNSTSRQTEPREKKRDVVQFSEIGPIIRRKRHAEGLTLADAAAQSGVSAATLSRLERRAHLHNSSQNGPLPDVRTLRAVAEWLGVAIASAASAPVEIDSEIPLPNLVEAHLRADRNLDPDTASFLGRLFRTAYIQATKDAEAESANRESQSYPSGEKESK